MSTTLRYDRKTAKRNHTRRCEMTGLPIEKGDRFFVGVFVDGGDLCSIKAHSIIQEMAHESMDDNCNHDEGWDPWEAPEYLLEWLRKRLNQEEVTICHKAALEYWKGNNNAEL